MSWRSIVLRFLLCALLVAVAHQLEWAWLKHATSSSVLSLLRFTGTATDRVSGDMLRVGHEFFQFGTSCTFVDVCAGALPLLWRRQLTVIENIWALGVAVMALMLFNVLRLTVSQLLHAQGISWDVADGVVGGFSYFLVWLAIMRSKAWSERRTLS